MQGEHMLFEPHRRSNHLRDLWSHGLLGKGLSFAWTVYGIFSAWRSEFIKTTDLDKWGVIAMIPHLSVAWWLVGALIILCIWVFEASFRSAQTAKRNVHDSHIKISSLEDALESEKADNRQIIIRYDGDMAASTLSGMHRAFVVSVKNNSSKSTIRNCQIETWIPLSGDFSEENYWPSSEPFDLKPQQIRRKEILRASITDPNELIEQVQYFSSPEGWNTNKKPFSRVLPLGTHHVYIRVIADDKAPAFLEIILHHTGRWDAYIPKSI